MRAHSHSNSHSHSLLHARTNAHTLLRLPATTAAKSARRGVDHKQQQPPKKILFSELKSRIQPRIASSSISSVSPFKTSRYYRLCLNGCPNRLHSFTASESDATVIQINPDRWSLDAFPIPRGPPHASPHTLPLPKTKIKGGKNSGSPLETGAEATDPLMAFHLNFKSLRHEHQSETAQIFDPQQLFFCLILGSGIANQCCCLFCPLLSFLTPRTHSFIQKQLY